MVICSKTFRACFLLCLLSLLLSGTASAFVDVENLTGPASSSGRAPVVPYRGLYFAFDAEASETGLVQAETQTFEVPQEPVQSLAAYGKEFVPDLLQGTKRIFSDDNLTIALVGAALAGVSAAADHGVKNYFQSRRPMDRIATYGDTAGQGYYHVAVGGALLGAGELANDPKLALTGVTVLESLLVNGVVTEGLKYAAHRTRPNGKDHMSFPSGHTSSTATLAASISEMYDWDPRVAVPLYAGTIFVGLSRIQGNMHYLSDVVAGLTIGTVIGRSFAKYHKEKNEERAARKVSFTPIYDKDIKGALFTMKW